MKNFLLTFLSMITFLLAVDIPVMVSSGINISGIQFTLRGACDDPDIQMIMIVMELIVMMPRLKF